MESKVCKKIIVQGRVQGVFFRDAAKERACLLNIMGYVCNIDNGAVEIIACGAEGALEEFIQWAHQGPLLAKIKNVSVSDTFPEKEFNDFEIRY